MAAEAKNEEGVRIITLGKYCNRSKLAIMWSDRYNYYDISSDDRFSEKIETRKIINLLLQTGLFVQTTHQCFTNSVNFPWVDIIITETANGNWAATEQPLPYINLIAIVCSKGKEIDPNIYENVFLDIAEALNWKLFLEADDDDNEDIEIKRT